MQHKPVRENNTTNLNKTQNKYKTQTKSKVQTLSKAIRKNQTAHHDQHPNVSKTTPKINKQKFQRMHFYGQTNSQSKTIN